MKVIIAGGRNFTDFDFLKKWCDYYLSNHSGEIEIVSGGATGVDALGERYAIDKVYKLKIIPANWDLGKKAGRLRNKQMAEYADCLLAFWDGTSKGTKNMIEQAKENNLKVRIVKI